MIGRVIITSVQKGLGDGPGFQPVLRTKNLGKPVVDYVLRETGYNHPFPPGDSRNPTIYSHRIATIQGTRKHFLIRTDDAVSDYSGRSNRLSQCLVIDDSDLGSTQTGPCEILLGFPWETSWPVGRKPFLETVSPPWKIIDQPKTPCLSWQQATGDAGWAGRLSLSVGQQQKVVLVSGLEHDVLTLFLEALALLPVQSRWGVTFSSCELDPTDVLWKAVRRDINSKPSTSNNDLLLDLKEIKARQQTAPESQLTARARGEVPKTAQKPVTHEREQSHTATEKTQRISRGIRPRHVRNDTTGKGRPPQNQKNQQIKKAPEPPGAQGAPSNQPGLDIFPNRRLIDGPKLTIVVLVMALVFAVSGVIWRESFFTGGFLNDVDVSNQSDTTKPIDLNRSPVHTNNTPSQPTPTEGSKETQTPKQTTTQDALPNEERMAKGLNKGDKKQKPPEEKPVAEKENTEDTIRQFSQKEIEDDVKNLMAASRQCSLPNVGLDNPQPIGIPWPVALSDTTTDIALSNDYLANVVVDYQEKNKTWNVSAKKAGVSGTKSVPIAEISQRDEMLFWKWTPNSDRTTATAMLFSRLSFPKLKIAKPFIFRHAIEAKTKTYTLQDCIPNGKDSMSRGQSIEVDDKFFITADAQNNDHLNLSWTGLQDNDTLWKRVQLRMRLVSASFKLNADVNSIDIKEILNSESPNTIRTVWSNEHLKPQIFCGLKVQPTIEVNIRDNGKGGWSASFTLKAVFIDDNTIPNNSFTNFLSDALESTDRTSSDIDALFKKNNYLKNYLNSDISQSDEATDFKSAEESMNAYIRDKKITNDGSNGRGGAKAGQMSQNEFNERWKQGDINKVKDDYRKKLDALNTYSSDLLKKQKDILTEILHDLKELRRESFDVTITCGLDSSDSKAGSDFDIPLVGTK